MMVMSHNVAKGLHDRFDKLGITLNDHHQEVTGILREIALSQKEMAASLKSIEHILNKKS